MTAPAVVAEIATASQASSLTIAATARAAQVAIAASAMREAVTLWRLLDAKRLNETFPVWLASMRLLTKRYHGLSAEAAARFYHAARTHATDSPTSRALIQIAPVPSDDWMSRAYGFSGPGMLSRDTVRPNTALSTTLGTTARIVNDGGRSTVLNTIHADKLAVGWYRVTDGHPCAFCALLASRGIAYKSEASADFKSHNDCGCTAAPAFTHDAALPAVNLTAAQVYRERGKGPALPAFRKAWAEHQSNTAA